MSGKILVLAVAISFSAVFLYQIASLAQIAEAQYKCPAGTYTTYCQGKKTWCSNKDRNPPSYACGCTCSTASCQDGNYLTYNSCGGSVCSSTSCPSGFADANNNPSDACETNLNTNPNNCGSVGNVCASGVCTGGSCDDFSLSIDPMVGIANLGDSKTVNTTLTVVAGSPSVAFSATGVPAGTTVTFGPTSCAPNCYSNATIATSGSTPTGYNLITIRGTAGSVVRSAVYNLTVLPSGVPATCGAPTTCDSGETQANCASDCFTTATIPGTVSPGDIVSVSVEFRDFRYLASGKVKIDLKIDGTTTWDSSNGCFFGGKKMGPTAGNGAIAWPPGTISENGHFLITATCTIPTSISAGAHTLVATPTIF